MQARPRRPIVPAGPPLPDDVTGRELDRDVRAELRSLPPDLAEEVARRLVMAGRLLEEDPEAAYQHALVARRRAARLAVVREAAGVAAHAAGHWADARSDLRAHARMTGVAIHLPLLADCERGLGHPERALELAGRPEVATLPVAAQIEMRIVAAGARQDLGQDDAAVVTLHCPQLRSTSTHDWVARLRYAYADALLRTGQTDAAREWFGRALDADPEGRTDAADRCAELDGVVWVEAADDEVADEPRAEAADDEVADEPRAEAASDDLPDAAGADESIDHGSTEDSADGR